MTRRLFFALAALAVVVLIVADAIGRHQVEVAERRGAVIDLERRAFRVALVAQDDLERQSIAGQPPLSTDELAHIRRLAVKSVDQLDAIAVVTDHRDRLVTTVARGVPRAYGAAIAHTVRTVRRDGTVAARSERIDGVDYEIVAVPIVANIGIVGSVVVAQRSEVLAASSSDRIAFLTPAFLGALALALVLAFVLARALSRPLEHLVAATKRVARDGTAAPSVEPKGPAEVRALADAFNVMSLRVRELMDRQGQFARDVSHQLRTPLTTLGVAVERTLQKGSAGDIDGAGQSLRAVQAEVVRLQQLVEGLLVLTRVPLADVVREPVDVAAIARDRVGMWRELARERQVTLTIAAPAGADALVVPGAVDQILDNLLDNAVEVAPPGSAIAIDVTAFGAEVVVAVADRGPGMTDTDRARAFDRFWRGDGSNAEGIGIGLTIVRDLAVACRGDIELLPAEGGGTRAVLTLEAAPRATDPPRPGSVATTSAATARLRARLTRYLRERDPERAAAVESEVWRQCTLDDADFDGCPDCATTVFALAHDRIDPLPAGDGRDEAELDAHLLRTLGGLDTEQIAQVLEVTPRTVVRLERRARRTLIPVVDGRLVPVPARRGLSRAARAGAIAAVAAVAATGTAAATGSLPDAVQHQVARVLRSVGLRVPDPEPDRPAGLSGARRSVGMTSAHLIPTPATATPTRVIPGPVDADDPTPAATAGAPGSGPPPDAHAPSAKQDGGGFVPPGQAKQDGGFVPPGQAKQDGGGFVPPGQAKQDGGGFVPPGQAKQDGGGFVPPGQAKQDGGGFVPPGQAKQDGGGTVPPGQAKKSGDAAAAPPGQAKKAR